ncbi:hypothetical protein [Antrihabitans cavernicola]|uniref:Uncharacterized protein n=1 Tax=Antrihabitans cavernicola TaxID=2495913 RepID=A0A5A7S8H1_9NOCA|nr:hypothetical protein [Spelaeibacter cavernicola]KAA0020174.1 hypothetical protein FOY51_21505 [Spelaeibacter cavernicola]
MDLFLKTLNSLWQVLLIGLVLGAGLPALFAMGIRCLSWTTIDKDGIDRDGSVGKRSVTGTAGALACFAVILVAIVTGILFVMKDFLAHDFGIHLF